MTDDTQRFWSVTTLVKLGLGTGDALVQWNARTPVEWILGNLDGFTALAASDPEAAKKAALDSRYRKTGKAQERGTEVHAMLEELALGREPEVSDAMLPYVAQLRRFLEDHAPTLLMAEAPVYNRTYGYAGTLDLILEIGGRTCILDAKSTDKTPDAKSRPPYPEIALQLVAYSRAELVGLDPAVQRYQFGRRYYVFDPALKYEPMPAVEGALALVVSPVDYRLVPVRIDEEVWLAFAHVREAAKWNVDISRRVLGPEITLAGTEEG